MGLIKDAIEAYRDRTYRLKTLQDYLSGTLNKWELLSQRGHQPDMDPDKLVRKYSGWAYPCATRNASAIAGAVLRLYATRGTGEGRARRKARMLTKGETATLKKRVYNSPRIKAAEEVEEIEDHAVLELLKNVNGENNQSDLMESLSVFQDLTGSCFWYVLNGSLGIPSELWVLPSQWTTIIPGKTQFIDGYRYGRDKQHQVFMEPEEVIWFRFQNPLDPWAGRGVIESAYWAITGYESMEKFETSQTENHGIKDLLISYKKGKLTAKQRRDLRREWANVLQETSRERAPIVADEDFDIKDAAWSPREMAFMQGRQWRKEEIICAFGQHPAMYDKNANTANIEGAIYLWEQYGITPRLKRIEQRLNEKLLPRYGEPRLFLAFDPVVESNREADRADWQLLMQNGFPLNRVLADMQRDPVEGGDVGYIGAMQFPLGGMDVQTTPQNTDQLKRVRRPVPLMEKQTSEQPVSHLMTKAADGTVDVERSGGPNPRLSPREIEMGRALRSVWSAQLPLALEQVPKVTAADFSWCASDTWAEEIYRLTHGLIREEMIIGGRMGARKIGIQMIDFIDRPRVQDYIKNHTFKFARQINRNTERKLRAILANGLQRGDSIPEIQRSIEATFTDWSSARAERVARYETSRALSAGTEAQWKETGVVVAKIWHAAGDACPFCLAMNGKEVGLGEPFIPEGGVQNVRWNDQTLTMAHNYEDVIGGDLHPNCKCTILPKPIET